MSSATNRQNILQLMRNRELNDHIRTKYALKSHLHYKCISKLGLFTQLHHPRCVNCIQWNESGSTLLSVCNNNQVVLWDPFLKKVKTTFTTSHCDRIYSFIPGCNDDVVATGGGDQRSYTYNVTTGKQLSSCICSEGVIKRLAVANDSPSVYWCASEDGYISQHDTRMSHKCLTDKSKTTLVTIYNNLGKKIKANCLDINPLKTEQLAVGANDQYVRLYDRRMIQWLPSLVENYFSGYDGYNINDALQYFVPGHIRSNDNEKKQENDNTISYLTFSPDGQELLVSYNCGNVYLFNLLNRSDNAFFNIPKYMEIARENMEDSATDLIDDQVPVSHSTPPDNVVHLKLKVRIIQYYSAAIALYNEAINIHKCCELFLNRAAAYINRKFFGDFYAALKDCVTALKLEPNHMKAQIQLAECLFQMAMLNESKMYLDQLTMKSPSYETCSAYKSLYSNLLNAQSNNKEAFYGKKLQTSNVLDVLDAEQSQKISFEKYFQKHSKDYQHRYFGHKNYFSEEANFFGSRNQFIVAGSDDGFIFVWEKNTENNLLILQSDDNNIVRCIQPHPSEFLLATNSVDTKVKLWSPLPDNMDNPFKMNDYSIRDRSDQREMICDQLKIIFAGVFSSSSST
ncbi:hypothetical protein QTP88_001470 [Uroleucon formosanum]